MKFRRIPTPPVSTWSGFGYGADDPEIVALKKLARLIPADPSSLPTGPDGQLCRRIGTTDETWFGPAPEAWFLDGEHCCGDRNLAPSPTMGAAFGRHGTDTVIRHILPSLPSWASWGWENGLVIRLGDGLYLTSDMEVWSKNIKGSVMMARRDGYFAVGSFWGTDAEAVEAAWLPPLDAMDSRLRAMAL